MLIKVSGWKWGPTIPSSISNANVGVKDTVSKVEGVFKSPSLPANKLATDTTRKFGAGQAAMKKLLPPEAQKTQTALLSSIKDVKAAGTKPVGAPSPPHTGMPNTSPVASTMKGISSQAPKAPSVAGGKLAASIGNPAPSVITGTQSLLAKAMGKDTSALGSWTSPGKFSTS